MEGIIRMRKLFLTFLFASLAVTGARAMSDNYYCTIFPAEIVAGDQQWADDEIVQFVRDYSSTACNQDNIEKIEIEEEAGPDMFPGSECDDGDGYQLVCVVHGECKWFVVSPEFCDVTRASDCSSNQLFLDFAGGDFQVGSYVTQKYASLLEEEGLYVGADFMWAANVGEDNLKVCVDCIDYGWFYTNWEDKPLYPERGERRMEHHDVSALYGTLMCPAGSQDYQYRCKAGYWGPTGLSSDVCEPCDSVSGIPTTSPAPTGGNPDPDDMPFTSPLPAPEYKARSACCVSANANTATNENGTYRISPSCCLTDEES